MTQTVTPMLSDRLIRELPRFFGGAEAMIKEALQNANRAGAKNVIITNKITTLTILDDGCGLTDPQILFTGGETAWDEQAVVEPAGLGVFSYLNPEIVRSVKFRSKNWSVTITPDFLYQPIGQEIVHEAAYLPGFEIDIQLVSPVKDQVIQKARGYFPFKVLLNDQLCEESLSGVVAERHTDLGRFVLLSSNSRLPHETHPRYEQKTLVCFWEHQPIADEIITGIVDYAFSNAGFPKFRMIWEIDSRTGIRPKLPDRSSFIDSAALRTAAGQAAAELIGMVSRAAEALHEEVKGKSVGRKILSEPMYHFTAGFDDGQKSRFRVLFNYHNIQATELSLFKEDYALVRSEDYRDSQDVERELFFSSTAGAIQSYDTDLVYTLMAPYHLRHYREATFHGGLLGTDFEGMNAVEVGTADCEVRYLRNGAEVLPDHVLLLDWADEITTNHDEIRVLPFMLRGYAPYVVVNAHTVEHAIQIVKETPYLAAYILSRVDNECDTEDLFNRLEIEEPDGGNTEWICPDAVIQVIVRDLLSEYSDQAATVRDIRRLEGLIFETEQRHKRPF